MPRVRGVITSPRVIDSPKGEVILEDLDIHLYETRSRGRRSWWGRFSVPGTASIEMDTYHLTLEDGREATIQVNSVEDRSDVRLGNHTAVIFLVSGLLAQPE